jgi:hypothetical protein
LVDDVASSDDRTDAGRRPPPPTRIDRAHGPRSVDRFLDAILGAGVTGCGAFAEDAVLDATTPDWRFTTQGVTATESEFAQWYADLGRFGAQSRTPVEGGGLVEFVLDWYEEGGPHRCHQMHLLALDDRGLIADDTALCGGRWDSTLMAEMVRVVLKD